MALIEGEEIVGSMSSGEHNVGCISQVEVSVAFQHAPSTGNVGSRERLNPVDAALDFFEECELFSTSNLGSKQVVKLREHER